MPNQRIDSKNKKRALWFLSIRGVLWLLRSHVANIRYQWNGVAKRIGLRKFTFALCGSSLQFLYALAEVICDRADIHRLASWVDLGQGETKGGAGPPGGPGGMIGGGPGGMTGIGGMFGLIGGCSGGCGNSIGPKNGIQILGFGGGSGGKINGGSFGSIRSPNGST